MGDANYISPDQWDDLIAERYLERQRNLAAFVERGDVAGHKKQYESDPVGFCTYVDVIDPRSRRGPEPLLLMPFQVRILEFFDSLVNCPTSGILSKCREVGCSWLAATYAVWMFVYQPDSRSLFVSKAIADVDSSQSQKSLLGKCRFVLDHLPKCWGEREYDSRFMNLRNPNNGATIAGAGGDSPARGDRARAIWLDEAAFLEHPEKTDAALGEVSPTIIAVSSTAGMNLFEEKRALATPWDGEARKGTTYLLNVDWWEDQRKNSDYVEERRAHYLSQGQPHIFEREIMRNPLGAVEDQLINPEWVDAAVGASDKMGWAVGSERRCGLDVGGSTDANAVVGMTGIEVDTAVSWMGTDMGFTVDQALAAARGGSLVIDVFGIGSGVVGEINRLTENEVTLPQIIPFTGGDKPVGDTGELQDDGTEKAYTSRLAEAYYSLAARFRRTYRATGGEGARVDYSPDECISLRSDLPELGQLKKELSQIKTKRSGEKLGVIKTPPGFKSPNLADALAQAQAPIPLDAPQRVSPAKIEAARKWARAGVSRPKHDDFESWQKSEGWKR